MLASREATTGTVTATMGEQLTDDAKGDNEESPAFRFAVTGCEVFDIHSFSSTKTLMTYRTKNTDYSTATKIYSSTFNSNLKFILL
jgi:hypothetical protein